MEKKFLRTHGIMVLTMALCVMICIFPACRNSTSAPPDETASDTQQSEKVLASATPSNGNETADEIDRTRFSGSYSLTDSDGITHLLQVDVGQGKLTMLYSGGGSAGFSYLEAGIEEKVKDMEYVVATKDVDGNGSLVFTFKLQAGGRANEVIISYPDEPDMPPLVLKAD